MIISEVRQLTPQERFLYWIEERHRIFLQRTAGVGRPWTDDWVLQHYFFTNPYREHDKVTVWFRGAVRDPLREERAVLFATIAFRWFSWVPTGMILLQEGLLTEWEGKRALRVLKKVRSRGGKIFTGAYLIQSPGREGKLEAIVRRIGRVWKDRERLTVDSYGWARLEDAHARLTEYDGLGTFMAYEVVCDLRYTEVLEHALDVCGWCNPGPGCVRGLYRLRGEASRLKDSSGAPSRPKDWQERMLELLKICQERFSDRSVYPPFEMREVEHSLCEWDKYERALWGDGRLKRTYEGTGAPSLISEGGNVVSPVERGA